MVCSDHSLVNRVNVSDREFFKQNLQGKGAVSRVTRDSQSGEPVFVISSPTYAAGAVNGAVMAFVSMNYLVERFLRPIEVGKTGYVHIVNEQGSVIAHAEDSKIAGLDMGGLDFGGTFRKEERGIVSFEWKGERNIAGFGVLKQTGWTLAVGITEKEILAPVARMGRILMLLGGVLLFFVGFSIWFLLGRFVVTPVKNVAVGLKDIAQGEGVVR